MLQNLAGPQVWAVSRREPLWSLEHPETVLRGWRDVSHALRLLLSGYLLLYLLEGVLLLLLLVLVNCDVDVLNLLLVGLKLLLFGLLVEQQLLLFFLEVVLLLKLRAEAAVNQAREGMLLEFGRADDEGQLDHRVDAQEALLLQVLGLGLHGGLALLFLVHLGVVLGLLPRLGDLLDGQLEGEGDLLALAVHVFEHVHDLGAVEFLLLLVDTVDLGLLAGVVDVFNDLTGVRRRGLRSQGTWCGSVG